MNAYQSLYWLLKSLITDVNFLYRNLCSGYLRSISDYKNNDII